MALTYTLVVTGAPYGTQQSSSAYQFVNALLARGHHLNALFFYREGVLNANQFTTPANDEFNLIPCWQALANDYQFSLFVCVAAALRRGVLGVNEAKQYAIKGHNLMPGFQMVGLGALTEAMLISDRTIQF